MSNFVRIWFSALASIILIAKIISHKSFSPLKDIYCTPKCKSIVLHWAIPDRVCPPPEEVELPYILWIKIAPYISRLFQQKCLFSHMDFQKKITQEPNLKTYLIKTISSAWISGENKNNETCIGNPDFLHSNK